MTEKWHYLEQYMASAQHRITINLVGCGGTGSHVLTNLAMMNYSLAKLGRQPLFVRAWDPDIITDHNVGRQMFSPADIGRSKSEVLIERINRFYGTAWHYEQTLFNEDTNGTDRLGANVTISCVDSVKSRRGIHAILGKDQKKGYRDHYYVPYYWIDIGNEKSSGQILLTAISKIKQPKGGTNKLPHFFYEFPGVVDDPDTPSCSMAEALASQDLFINKLMATYATHMLWNLLTNFRIDYRGIYINLENLKVSKIPLI